MFGLSSTPPNQEESKWRSLLNEFLQANQQELAALVWGLYLEWEDKNNILGIDLKPKPHFVTCSRSAVEELNRKVHNNLREILGVLDGYKPEEEVVIIVIGDGQINLIDFKPEPAPPVCFEQLNLDIDRSIKLLEEDLDRTMQCLKENPYLRGQ